MRLLIKISPCVWIFAAGWPTGIIADTTTNAPLALDQPVRAIALQPDGKVVIGGDFAVVAGATRGHVARLKADGTTDFTFLNNLSGANASVYSTALQSDGKILIAGIFRSVNGLAQIGLARLNTNGFLDMSFNAVTGSAPFAVQADGKLLVDTALLTGDTSHDSLFRLNVNGTRDTNWPVAQINGTVSALAQQSDGKIILGGTVSVNGTIRQGVARLNTNGVVDATFLNGMPGVPGLINCVTVRSDGKVLIGGYFFFVNNVNRTRIAQLNSDGSLDTTFQNGMAGADGEVEAIAVQPDGKILLGGYFRSVNNTPRAGIARLNTDGSVDTGFQNGMTGADLPIVLAIALQPNGKVIVGGAFTAMNGVPRYRIACLNADGSLDKAFQNGGQPLLSAATIQFDHFQFQISGQSNQEIIVEASTNLLNWLPLTTNILSSNTISLSDPVPANFRMRFYRARVQ
jgi:uncharacterized delta-60 repeat protein